MVGLIVVVRQELRANREEMRANREEMKSNREEMKNQSGRAERYAAQAFDDEQRIAARQVRRHGPSAGGAGAVDREAAG